MHPTETVQNKTMMSFGMLRRVALVRTDVSEEPGASFIRVTKISELGRTQAATSNRRTTSPILVTLMMEVQIPPKPLFLLEPHGITCRKTAFSNFTYFHNNLASSTSRYHQESFINSAINRYI
jgi:hypothetical protein